MSEKITIQIVQMDHAKGLDLPHYATEGAAGMDLVAAIDTPMTLKPLQRDLVPTGLQMAIPFGYEVQIRPRSGLAYKNGITVINSPGTIDSDYRGEVKIILANMSDQEFTIEPGMRIAQMVVAKHEHATLQPVETLDETTRGEGGFGSTGVRKVS